jgi:hypothetical protein
MVSTVPADLQNILMGTATRRNYQEWNLPLSLSMHLEVGYLPIYPQSQRLGKGV